MRHQGYGLAERAAASTQRDAAYGFLVFDSIQALFHGMSATRRVQLGVAFHFLLEVATPDLIVAKLSEAGDRGQRCMSAKKLGFNLLVRCACELKEAADEEGAEGVAAAILRQQSDLTSAAGAKEHVLTCFEDFLDDHKSNAFASAFIEPARFYFTAVGDANGERHVNVQCALPRDSNRCDSAPSPLPTSAEERSLSLYSCIPSTTVDSTGTSCWSAARLAPSCPHRPTRMTIIRSEWPTSGPRYLTMSGLTSPPPPTSAKSVRRFGRSVETAGHSCKRVPPMASCRW